MVVRGVRIRGPLNRYNFSSILAEWFMNFNSVFDIDNMTDFQCEMQSILEE